MNRSKIWEEAKKQLAVDLACSPADFDRPGITFCPSADLPGRRPFLRKEPVFDMVSFGKGTVISAEEALLPQLQRQLFGLERDRLWSQSFLRSLGHYFLPDPGRMVRLSPPAGLCLEWRRAADMEELYRIPGFSNALGYDLNASRPDVLALCAWEENQLAGVAGASEDCRMLWQVGVDVLPAWRGRGLGAALVSALSLAVLEEGRIPYYGTSSSNLASQRTAQRAGYCPAWVCSYGVDLG